MPMPDDKCILDPERDCIGKAAAAKLEARIESLERWQKDSKEFHNTFYNWQKQSTTGISARYNNGKNKIYTK